MTTFEYRGFDRAGDVRQGAIEARDPKDARAKLAASGVMAERVEEAGRRAPGWLGRRPRRRTIEARGQLYRELATLLQSGMTLQAALQLLLESPEAADSHGWLARVREGIREGSSLSDALVAGGIGCRPMERALLEAGERSGALSGTLERLADFLQEEQEFAERIRSALTYPAVIFFFALVVAIVMLGFVVPSASRLLEESRIELPALTRAMAGAGRVLLVTLPLAVLAGLWGMVLYRRRAREDVLLRVHTDRLLFRMPLVARAYRLQVNLRFARALEILLHGGVSIPDAMETAAGATGSAWIMRLMETEREAVRHGSSLADAVRRIPPLAGSLPLWIQTGEAAGSLEPMLRHAASRYQQHWTRFVSRALSLLEPALIAVLGAFILLVALSILLPVVALNQSLL